MKKKATTIRFTHPAIYLFGILLAFVFITPKSEAFPIGDAFDKKQEEAEYSLGLRSNDPTAGAPHRSLNPLLTDGYDEPHPFPEYLKKFGGQEKFPEYYRQLLIIHPEDQVQSKVFDESAFKEVKRIGVLGFENKTYAPYIQPEAGDIVADQIYRELQSVAKYMVLSPPQMDELAFRMKIVSVPPSGKKPAGKEQAKTAKPQDIAQLPFTEKDMDGVLIGAVTKFMDTYKNERGELNKSLSGGVEFGAYLISAKTGKVIWGARYAGSQSVGLAGLFKGEPPGRWLDREELSRQAMKKVLRAFYDSQAQPKTLTPLNE